MYVGRLNTQISFSIIYVGICRCQFPSTIYKEELTNLLSFNDFKFSLISSLTNSILSLFINVSPICISVCGKGSGSSFGIKIDGISLL
jgi:hypothetical protein